MEKKVYIYVFKSYSYDTYYMKSHTKKYLTAENFCKDKIPHEFECWDNNFKYNSFKIFETTEDGVVKRNLVFGEYEEIVPADMKEYDIAYFTDQYSPNIFDSDGNQL